MHSIMPVLCMTVWILLTWMCNAFSGAFVDPAIEPRAQELKVRFEDARFARLMSRVYVQVFYSAASAWCAVCRNKRGKKVTDVANPHDLSTLRFRYHSSLFFCS